jgi:uncharacterized protein (TIGR03000 family)
MYSIVLMLSLSGGADVSAADLGRSHDNMHRLDGRRRGGCHGCSGCYGDCYGGCYGCSGYYGGYRYGCCGCYGGGYYPQGGMSGGRRSGYYNPEEELQKPGSDKDRPKPKPEGEGDRESSKTPDQRQLAAPATIIVSLPAEATLTIDDTPTRSRSNTRVFVTPPLEPGKVFHYTLKAETRRDGRTLNTSERIAVQASKETRVTLAFKDRKPEGE